jgi:hypothetical protein
VSLTSSYEVTTLLRPRAAVGRHQGVRPTSHLQGTFVRAHVEEGQAAPRGRPRPFSMILTAWKGKFSEVRSYKLPRSEGALA